LRTKPIVARLLKVVMEERFMETSIAEKKTADLRKTPVKEKLAYALGDVGCNFIWSFATSFLTLYYTDSAGLTAAFVGTMMLVSRLLDGASDIAMGFVLEKTKTRWGKARPWLLFGALPFALSLVLVMNVPSGFGEAGKQIYVYATYIFMAVFCYTAVNLAYHAMLPRFSFGQQDRNNISVLRSLLVVLLALIINVITPSLLAALGGERNQSTWSILAAVYATLAFICLMVTFFVVKERIPVERESDGSFKKVPLKDSAKAVLTNKYFYITLGLFLIGYVASGVTGIGVYYARDVLGNASYYSLMTLGVTIPMILAQFILPALFKKFGKRKVCMFSCIFLVIGPILILSNPYSLFTVLTACLCKGSGTAALSTIVFTFSADIVDYGEWKTGIRAEGFAYSATSFGMKVGTGLGAAILGWALSMGHYNAALATQMPETIQAIINVQAFSGIAIGVIEFVLLFLWDYDKIYPTIQKDMTRRLEASE
jgi:GPH family glycoside/pentoside/hexuronide:cation symporter